MRSIDSVVSSGVSSSHYARQVPFLLISFEDLLFIVAAIVLQLTGVACPSQGQLKQVESFRPGACLTVALLGPLTPGSIGLE